MRNDYILAMDTAGDFGSIAVLKGDDCLFELSWRDDSPHSRTLLPMIHSSMSVFGLELNRISLIAVNRGPGRWTGIRLGIATAKGLAMAMGIGVAGVAGLDAMAYGAGLSACMSGDVVFPVLNARRSQIYTAAYLIQGHFEDGSIETAVRQSDYVVIAPESFEKWALNHWVRSASMVKEGVKRRVFLMGDGVSQVLPFLQSQSLLKHVVVYEAPASFLPGAAWVGHTALQNIKSRVSIETSCEMDCTPLYIRPSDAEANKKIVASTNKE
ncbi:MAG: tRNA (adenosine(37)-N6)-threonylcarbamoyltransferase complex dimerization subunit type 1 TsaB [Dissulfuribacterales bacterium]